MSTLLLLSWPPAQNELAISPYVSFVLRLWASLTQAAHIKAP